MAPDVLKHDEPAAGPQYPPGLGQRPGGVSDLHSTSVQTTASKLAPAYRSDSAGSLLTSTGTLAPASLPASRLRIAGSGSAATTRSARRK